MGYSNGPGPSSFSIFKRSCYVSHACKNLHAYPCRFNQDLRKKTDIYLDNDECSCFGARPNIASHRRFSAQKPSRSGEDVVLKGVGHRVIVEFEKEHGHVKIFISPQEREPEEITQEKQSSAGPKELACDAYGKCKNVISNTLEAVAGKSHDAIETVAGVKDTISHSADQVFDKMFNSKDAILEKATEIKSEVEDKAWKTSERLKKAKREGRSAREVGADAFGYIFSSEKMAELSGELHLMGFAAAYGMCLWVTFVSSHVLAEALSRQQFGMVQSKIYPVYFKAMAYSVGMAMFGHLIGRNKSVGMFQGFNLMGSFVMILVNLLYLEPQATKVMLERMKKEERSVNEGKDTDAEIAGRWGLSAVEVGGRGEKAKVEMGKAKVEMGSLGEKLRKLNSYSSFLNASTLASLTWHLVHLGQRLHA